MSNAYLADAWAGMQAPQAPQANDWTQALPSGPVVPPPFPGSAAMDASLQQLAGQHGASPPPLAGQQQAAMGPPLPPPALPPPSVPPPTDPLAPQPQAPIGPPPPPGINVGPTAQADPNGPDPGEFPLRPIPGGGITPAHEVDLRGPSLIAAQNNVAGANAGAIGSVTGRTEGTAGHEFDMALDQERGARVRQAAADASAAERDEELSGLQNDFDQSVRALSQTSVDPNHFWSTRSTGQKVSAMVGLALGGFLQGARGGSNPGLDAINTAIERDVHAQEMAFNVKRDVANGRQTAFGLAMQKYGNVDAARSLARAAALDAVQAQVGQTGALWKGTDAANRADLMSAQLQTDRMNQIAQGVRFILPQATAPTFSDRYGIRYTNNQAQEEAIRRRAFAEKREEIGLNTAGGIITNHEKTADEIAKDKAEADSYGGLGKQGVQTLALEKRKAEMQRDADLNAIRGAQGNVSNVTKGTTIGSAAAEHLPAWFPGVTEAVQNDTVRENYNRRAMMIVAGAFKLGTDANEPKNKALLDHYSKTYTLKPREGDESALTKMRALAQLVNSTAEAKGVGASPGDAMPGSFTQHGKK